MREIGTLPTERDAMLFRDMLYLRGIESDIEHATDGACEIWVHDDDQLEEAKGLMETYRAGMDATEVESSSATAARQRRETELRDRRRSSRVITRERLGYDRMAPAGFTTVPLVLTVLSVLMTLWAGELGLPGPQDGTYDAAEMTKFERQAMLSISDFRVFRGQDGFGRIEWDPTLPEIRHGQVWRLFTPMFIHFGILHLLFNLMWLRDLGGFMEMRFGALYISLFVLASAALSNVPQFFMSGPSFGGMSGVNYALFGFLWARAKWDRTVAWAMPPQIAFMMFAWLVICMTGAMGSVANTAHVAGLVCGVAWGYLTARHASRR